MASVAKWNNDNNTTLITSGSSGALTLVTNQVESALTSGFTVAFTFGTGASSNATLAVDGLTAASLQQVAGTNLSGGEYAAGNRGSFTYSSTGSGQWIAAPTPVKNNATPPAIGSGSVASPVGTASATGVMMGLGSTFTFTPTAGTRCIVTMVGYGSGSNISTINIGSRYGTGTAPVNGAAITGTVGSLALSGYLAAAFASVSFCHSFIVTGLVVGTAYWVDLSLANVNSISSTVNNITFTAHEI